MNVNAKGREPMTYPKITLTFPSEAEAQEMDETLCDTPHDLEEDLFATEEEALNFTKLEGKEVIIHPKNPTQFEYVMQSLYSYFKEQ